ncbi:hypothetical protein FHS17_003551 [Paenibacillus lupini]|nr:hypothetical protein [Paenibacillus lupini]
MAQLTAAVLPLLSLAAVQKDERTELLIWIN